MSEYMGGKMSKRRIELKKKGDIIRRHLLDKESILALSSRYHISRDSIHRWKKRVIEGIEKSLVHLSPKKTRRRR